MNGQDESPDLAAEIAALRADNAPLRTRVEALADWVVDLVAGCS